MVRGQRVMIDRDLSELYGVETKRLKEAVSRNINRFPSDWRRQNAASKKVKQGLRYTPFCFTEQGVTTLSCVLNSQRAIAANIQVIRVFTKMWEILSTHKDILLKLEQIERKIGGYDEGIRIIFAYPKQLLNPLQQPKPRIGYRRQDEKDY